MTTDVVQRTPMQEVIAQVRGEVFKQQIADALPGNVTPERFVRVAVTAIQQQPDLIATRKESLFASIVKCAQDGLLPDGREAALVKFGNDCAYLPMVGGLRKVAAKHGITLNAFVVYANDEFDYTLGEAPHVHHKPPRLGDERGEPIGAYAVATYQDAAMVCPPEVMSKDEIEKVRNVSRAKGAGPWSQWWDQMARKTVARRLFKQLPLGDLDEQATRIIEAVDNDADLAKLDTGLTVDEANVVAPLAQITAPKDPGPDDEVVYETGDVDAAARTLVPKGVYAERGMTIAEVAELGREGEAWLLATMKKPRTDLTLEPFRDALEVFVEHRLPAVWEPFVAWQSEQQS